MQFSLGLFRKQVRAHRRHLPRRLRPGLLQDLADAFEGDGQGLKVFGLADGANGFHTPNGVDQVIRASRERRVDLIIGQVPALL